MYQVNHIPFAAFGGMNGGKNEKIVVKLRLIREIAGRAGRIKLEIG
jgi:hypothetical protein